MTPQELDNTTPRQFHNRLNGWKQRRQIESVEAWRQTREIIASIIPLGHWKQGQAPNIYRSCPLPGDPKPKDHTAQRKFGISQANKWGWKLPEYLAKEVN